MNENSTSEALLSPDGSQPSTEFLTVVILDSIGTRLAECLDLDAALTVMGLMSEDPYSWDEALDLWPRYRTPAVCEFASSLPFAMVEPSHVLDSLETHKHWMVLDLVQKRVLTSSDVQPLGREQAYDMDSPDQQQPSCPLFINLPPWWELVEQVPPSAVRAARTTPICKPHVDRRILYGDALLNDLAKRILSAAHSTLWKFKKASTEQRARYTFTVAVHRQWLMTGRPDLGGRMPRQLLHGAMDWLDKIIEGQRSRYHYLGQLFAIPEHTADFETAPMGREEVVYYFELCRELIEAGWMWCTIQSEQTSLRQAGDRDALVAFLRDVKTTWMEDPFEGGASPSLAIECGRRRVPQASGVAIEGMSQIVPKTDLIDCDCPICQMMAEDSWGPSFQCVDGHHLELDNEFAFSMYETREEWSEMQAQFLDDNLLDNKSTDKESTAESDRSHDPCTRETLASANSVSQEEASDEFASVWSGSANTDHLPGDPQGHLLLAFRLAEIISDMQDDSPAQSDPSSQSAVQTLNRLFIDFRHSTNSQLMSVAEQLKEALQSSAERFPKIVSKVADLQSRIDEQLRAPV